MNTAIMVLWYGVSYIRLLKKYKIIHFNIFGFQCFKLKAFDDAFETIYGDSEVNFIQVQQISEELKTNCLRLISLAKNQKDSSKDLYMTYNVIQIFSHLSILNKKY